MKRKIIQLAFVLLSVVGAILYCIEYFVIDNGSLTLKYIALALFVIGLVVNAIVETYCYFKDRKHS